MCIHDLVSSASGTSAEVYICVAESPARDEISTGVHIHGFMVDKWWLLDVNIELKWVVWTSEKCDFEREITTGLPKCDRWQVGQ